MTLAKQPVSKKNERPVQGARSRVAASSALRNPKRSVAAQSPGSLIVNVLQQKSVDLREPLGGGQKVFPRVAKAPRQLQRKSTPADLSKFLAKPPLTRQPEAMPLPPNPLSAIAAKIQAEPELGVRLAVQAGILNEDGSLVESYA